MASRGTQLFVGRLSKETKLRDLENVFYLYGKLLRCDLKTAYGFIEYEDPRDAEEAMRRENNRKLFGSRIVVEYVRSGERGKPVGGQTRPTVVGDECFVCGKLGHWASSCPSRGDPRDSRDVLTDSRPPYRPRRRPLPPPPPRYRSRSRSPPPRRGYGPPPRARRRSMSPPRRPRPPPPMNRGRDRYARL
ncbi:predicted protein [Nematostella vectensis]|uniref:Uncharacterized protein n=1 Tax=Nematostella vectensis TaxID=45351 RepID=A7RGY6_NEMVE|nr:predicted protein [Nematostella vectensis]|eukprot:XP_001641195.1 predicted protein [Nematostella vectensis]